MPETQQVDCLDSKHLEVFAGCDHYELLLFKNNLPKNTHKKKNTRTQLNIFVKDINVTSMRKLISVTERCCIYHWLLENQLILIIYLGAMKLRPRNTGKAESYGILKF